MCCVGNERTHDTPRTYEYDTCLTLPLFACLLIALAVACVSELCCRVLPRYRVGCFVGWYCAVVTASRCVGKQTKRTHHHHLDARHCTTTERLQSNSQPTQWAAQSSERAITSTSANKAHHIPKRNNNSFWHAIGKDRGGVAGWRVRVGGRSSTTQRQPAQKRQKSRSQRVQLVLAPHAMQENLIAAASLLVAAAVIARKVRATIRNQQTSLVVVVGSTNPCKVNAVKNVLAQYPELCDARVVAQQVDTGVSAQPMSMEEIVKGAKHRAVEAAASSDADNILSLGIESGIMSIDHRYYDVCACSAWDRTRHHLGFSCCFEIPQRVGISALSSCRR